MTQFRENTFEFPLKSTAIQYVISPITVYNDENELFETKVGTTQFEMPLHYTVHGKTEKESRKRAKKLVSALVDRNINRFTYLIYTLSNPFTGEIFYIGKTNQALELRLRGHVTGINNKENNNEPKRECIREIISKGGIPTIKQIEVIEGTCVEDEEFANQRELFWINHFKNSGMPILNVKTAQIKELAKDIKEVK